MTQSLVKTIVSLLPLAAGASINKRAHREHEHIRGPGATSGGRLRFKSSHLEIKPQSFIRTAAFLVTIYKPQQTYFWNTCSHNVLRFCSNLSAVYDITTVGIINLTCVLEHTSCFYFISGPNQLTQIDTAFSVQIEMMFTMQSTPALCLTPASFLFSLFQQRCKMQQKFGVNWNCLFPTQLRKTI